MAIPGGELVRVQQLQVQLQAIQSENEHLKSKVVDCTICQNLQAQLQELQCENDELKLSAEQLTKAREIVEVTLRQRDEMIFGQCEKLRLLEEQYEPFYEVQFEFDSEICLDTEDNSEKDLILSLQTQLKETAELVKEYESNVSKISITSSTLETKNMELVKEMRDIVKCFDEEKNVFETKISTEL
ncbi:hypothetical protein Tco_0585002 [Tanacetum coccineum]